MAEARVSVRGMPDDVSVTEVNVRAGAARSQAALFKTPVGTSDLILLEVAPDTEGKNLNGKVYQWFKVRFGDGREGWIRDDLLFLEGDATAWGYPVLNERTWVFPLTRNEGGVSVTPAVDTPKPSEAAVVAPDPVTQAPTTTTTVPLDPVITTGPAPVEPVAPVVVVSSPTVLPSPAAPTVTTSSPTVLPPPASPTITTAPTVTVASPTVLPSAPTAVASPTTPAPVQPAAPVATASPSDPAEMARVRRLAFLITGAFEGHGYAAYNNYDAGIVSYGIIQFTLAAGSLVTVVNRYLERSQSEAATKLRGYQAAVNNRDPLLRNDMGFKAALIAAASDPVMQQVQDEVATEGFWKQVVDGYITPRNMVLPFSYGLLFDMGVNFGVNHGFVRLAEQQLGIPTRSVVGTNGVTEEILMKRVAELRKQSHDRQAERDNLPGLRMRGDFWMNLVNAGDWYMHGDSTGTITVNGRRFNARNPS
jgi:hypothetical protein